MWFLEGDVIFRDERFLGGEIKKIFIRVWSSLWEYDDKVLRFLFVFFLEKLYNFFFFNRLFFNNKLEECFVGLIEVLLDLGKDLFCFISFCRKRKIVN